MATEQKKKKPDPNAAKKKIIIDYFAEVPVYKYAAMAAGITDETLIAWRKADLEFSNRLNQARAKWVMGRLPKARVEFALERLEKEIFAPPKQEVELDDKRDPLDEILKKFGLGKEEGKTNDGQDDGAAESPSPKNS